MDQSFRDEMAAGYALTEPAPRDRQPDARGRARQRRPGPGRAVDAQPPRADRRRHRHRQDEDAAAARGPAVEGRGAGLHQRHQGRRVGHGRAGRRDQPEGPGAGGVAELDVPAERPPRRVPVAVGQAGRPGPGDGPLLRAAAPRQGPRPERDPDLDPRPRVQVLRRQRACRCSTSTTSRRRSSTSRRTRASRSSRTTAGCRRPRSACSCARSSSSSRPGVDAFFGEPEFQVVDLLRTTPDSQGVVSILELSDVMDQPRLFSTFMLWMLAQLYETLPEVGDLPQPKLFFFFDEAHLLFHDASEALHRADRADRPAHPLEGRRRVLRDAGADRRPLVGPRPARQPRPARAPGVHARRRRRAAEDRPDVPDDDPLRRREDDHVARHRRGVRDGALASRRPDAARGDAPPAARFADGRPADRPTSRPASRRASIGTKYATAIDRESAHEIITGRIAAARATAAQAAADQAMRAGVPPTTAGGLNTMTPAQQQREIQRQAREIAAAQKAAERERKAEARQQAALERERIAAEKRQARQVETAIRTAGKVLTSQDGPGDHPRRVRDAVQRPLTARRRAPRARPGPPRPGTAPAAATPRRGARPGPRGVVRGVVDLDADQIRLAQDREVVEERRPGDPHPLGQVRRRRRLQSPARAGSAAASRRRSPCPARRGGRAARPRHEASRAG